MAIDLLNALIEKGEGKMVRNIFDSVPPNWKKQILSALDEKINKNILSLLR